MVLFILKVVKDMARALKSSNFNVSQNKINSIADLHFSKEYMLRLYSPSPIKKKPTIRFSLRSANYTAMESPLLTITICGGGNGAHVAAGYLASRKGFRVNVLTRRPKDWSQMITVYTEKSSWAYKGTITGTLYCVTDDPSLVISGSDIIFVAAPANAHYPILKKIACYLQPHVLLGTLFAQGGFDWAVLRALDGDLSRVHAIFGIQNIPWLCRIREYGKSVEILGPKQSLWLASIPLESACSTARLVAVMFEIRTEVVPNFLSLTLTPSNQIIHPARYFGIFHDWDGVSPIKKDKIQWGLYSEMDSLSAFWMEKLDTELQNIKKGLVKRVPALDLSYVIPLGQRVVLQYQDDVGDCTNLQTIFATNRAYAECITPVTEVPGGYKPAVHSRLFWEDIPYGLCILKNIAEMLNLATPAIDKMIEWHQHFMNKSFLINGSLNREIISETASPEAYGIRDIEKLVFPSLPVEVQKALLENKKEEAYYKNDWGQTASGAHVMETDFALKASANGLPRVHSVTLKGRL
ncbi:naD/naDP octopine/nopaline dehydrogenase, alpha-helical domain-containing protein [Cardiosporidium cionae]|uniref:NaD/naDP octopine/nopaline dehydrogenase, alpha-helical domain-containing protein n=1 Tax=Cardiosporidium cionae TaxID=476202 RepID=A0ABQ7J8M1_9APIC|nr:naD/naDP octopine/nopaline dehydrogenase, alpha-helical domain-containing protein [Cardiosporidium cionae]|eukprot:KAF8820340.1 naD/naDP octopine/nopaline dehydrogenase, alpha-helical domain-containing protein [Cardiosporidium cionae]